MQPIVYFFGSLPGGFSSYPQNHTKAFFEDFIKRSKNMLQIVVHRKNNLLHYGYVRKFNDNYFGICICIDRIYENVGLMFEVLDDVFANMVDKGDILKMPSAANIEWNLKSFASESVAINEYAREIVERLDVSEENSMELPPADFSISINDCLELSLESSKEEIADATKRYSNVYIVKKKAEIERMTGITRLIESKDKEIKNLKKKNAEISSQLQKAKIKQRNTFWVSVLGGIILVLGVILWNKVLFPSEVTHYETGEFVYYGPMKNKKPHGVGVAIYPQNDEDGRKYYIGNFENGERQDTAAILFYQAGDYFYGMMKGDKWESGLLYKCSDGTYFKGTFNQNIPYNGDWYDHFKKHHLVDGEVVY